MGHRMKLTRCQAATAQQQSLPPKLAAFLAKASTSEHRPLFSTFQKRSMHEVTKSRSRKNIRVFIYISNNSSEFAIRSGIFSCLYQPQASQPEMFYATSTVNLLMAQEIHRRRLQKPDHITAALCCTWPAQIWTYQKRRPSGHTMSYVLCQIMPKKFTRFPSLLKLA